MHSFAADRVFLGCYGADASVRPVRRMDLSSLAVKLIAVTAQRGRGAGDPDAAGVLDLHPGQAPWPGARAPG